MSQVRKMKDLNHWKDNPLDCAKIMLDPEEFQAYEYVEALYYGPDKTPYENGVFKIQVKFSSNYPFNPPSVHFKTKIYHINVNHVHDPGRVRFGKFREWNPQCTLRDIVVWLDELISNPVSTKFSNKHLVDEFVNQREKYEENARQWTAKYAIPEIQKREENEDKHDNQVSVDDKNDNYNGRSTNKEINKMKKENQQLESEINKVNNKNKDMKEKLKQFEPIISETKYV